MVESHEGNAYRTVYKVQHSGVVYVLHVFQKKSKRAIAMPRQHLELIRARLKEAREHHSRKYRKGTSGVGGGR